MPWGSVEEKEEDGERMRQLIQQLEGDEMIGAEPQEQAEVTVAKAAVVTVEVAGGQLREVVGSGPPTGGGTADAGSITRAGSRGGADVPRDTADNTPLRKQQAAGAAASSRRDRGQQAALQAAVLVAAAAVAAPGYCGPQPSQAEAGSRQHAHHSGSSSKRAKARQSMAGVDTGDSRVLKSRRTSELSVARVELGHDCVGGSSITAGGQVG